MSELWGSPDRRRSLLVLAVVAVVVVAVVVAGVGVAAWQMGMPRWHGRADHRLVPRAVEVLDRVPAGLAPPQARLHEDLGLVRKGAGYTSWSLVTWKPRNPLSPLGLTVGYQRFEATTRRSGAAVAREALHAHWPPRAEPLTRLGDEAYRRVLTRTGGEPGGMTTVEVHVRDRNVQVDVSYRSDLPVAQTVRVVEGFAAAAVELLHAVNRSPRNL